MAALNPFGKPDTEMDATCAAFDDPQVGDRFHEWYSFWVYVVRVDGEQVATVEASAPCDLPKDGRLRHFPSRAAFRAAYAYGSIPGYSVILAGRGKNVTGWYESLLARFPIDPPEPEPVPVYDEWLLDAVGQWVARRYSGDGLGFLSAGEQRRRAVELVEALRGCGYEIERATAGAGGPR